MNNPTEYKKSEDYATIYADNVILQLGRRNCKLIFYQYATELNDDNSNIEKNKKCKKLKHEIRLPNDALERLFNDALTLIKMNNMAVNLVSPEKEFNTRRSWWELDNTLESIYYDTENPILEKEELGKLKDALDNFSSRILKNNETENDTT